MTLRKCPACRETVGAESPTCPRCGVSFKAATVRRIIARSLALLTVAWLLVHFVFKVI
jgi:uncharacterized paraquat-inducible protein A